MPLSDAEFVVPRMRLVELTETRMRRPIAGSFGRYASQLLSEPLPTQYIKRTDGSPFVIDVATAIDAIGDGDSEVFLDASVFYTYVSKDDLIHLSFGR